MAVDLPAEAVPTDAFAADGTAPEGDADPVLVALVAVGPPIAWAVGGVGDADAPAADPAGGVAKARRVFAPLADRAAARVIVVEAG